MTEQCIVAITTMIKLLVYLLSTCVIQDCSFSSELVSAGEPPLAVGGGCYPRVGPLQPPRRADIQHHRVSNTVTHSCHRYHAATRIP